MVNKSSAIVIITTIALTGIGAYAQNSNNHQSPVNPAQISKFQQIEQPLSNKIFVTAGGLSLIGLELWWFLISKPKSQKII